MDLNHLDSNSKFISFPLGDHIQVNWGSRACFLICKTGTTELISPCAQGEIRQPSHWRSVRSARVVAAVPLGPLPAGGRTPDPLTGGGQGVARAGLIEPVSGAGAAFGLDRGEVRSA